MIVITIDYNNNTILLDAGELFQVQYKWKGDIVQVETLLIEVCNMLEHTGVAIVRVDEDHRATVMEW